MIVGLMGKARSGKDTAADILVEEFGYKNVAFSDEVKRIAIEHFGCTHEEVYVEKTALSRRILQGIGDGLREEIDKNIWIDKVLNEGSRDKLLAIPCIRYHNEAKVVRSLGGVIVKIVRDDRPDIEYNADHVSEMEQEGIVPDITIYNNSTVGEFRKHVKTAFETLKKTRREKV